MNNLKSVIADVASIIKPKCVENYNIKNLDEMLELIMDVLMQKSITVITAGDANRSEKISTGQMLQKFIECFKVLLDMLSNELNNIQAVSKETCLSNANNDHVVCLLQFVFKFGLVSHFEPNVYAKHSSDISHFFTSFSPRQRCKILFENAIFIHSICKALEVKNLIMNNMLTEILAAFMQLCFSSNSARMLELKERKICLNVLNEIVEFWISKSRLIKEILILQGNAENQLSPKWLREKCGMMLTRTLLEKGGVRPLVLNMVANFSSEGQTVGWEQIIALSSIISTLPSKGTTPHEYCSLICPQILELLIDVRKIATESAQEIMKVAVTTLHALHEKYTEESKIFEMIICKTLIRCSSDSGDDKLDHGSILPEDLNNCIENLYQICVSVGIVPDTLLVMLIRPYLRILFHLLCDIGETSSHLISFSKALISKLLKQESNSESEILFFAMFGEKDGDKLHVKATSESLKFVLDESGNICPSTDVENLEPSELLRLQDIKVNTLLDILLNLEKDGFIGIVFISLLKCVCDPMKNFPQQIEDEIILSAEDRAVHALKNNEMRFITFGLLSSMCETFDPKILLSDVSQIIDFVKTILSRYIKSFDKDGIETLGTCISVLSICLMVDLTSPEKHELASLVPLLQKLGNEEELDDQTKDLLSDLTIAISTFGAVSVDSFSELMKNQVKNFELLKMNKNTESDQVKSEKTLTQQQDLVKERQKCFNNTTNKSISTQYCEDILKSHKDNSELINKNSISKSVSCGIDLNLSFTEALDAVFDPSPAVKGGSIRYLTKCIEQRVHAALEKLDHMTEIFMECLDDQDSFVYLSAVQGLAVVGSLSINNLNSETLLNKLISKFTYIQNTDGQKDIVLNFDIAAKMKLGEIIMRIIRQMGDMGPHHALVLLPGFLQGCKHENADMRASCLSNFAELAPLAPHCLSQIQHEVSDCLSIMAKSDSDDLVRRAAVHAIRQLITRLDEKFIQIFSNVAKDFYRTIKYLFERDNDTVVQLHAQLALEELDKIMRSSIFQKQTLSKKITVLPT